MSINNDITVKTEDGRLHLSYQSSTQNKDNVQTLGNASPLHDFDMMSLYSTYSLSLREKQILYLLTGWMILMDKSSLWSSP